MPFTHPINSNYGRRGNAAHRIWTGTQLVAVGNGGAILTSPEDLAAIKSRLPVQNHLSLHLTLNYLVATLPISLRGKGIHATIKTVSGNKLVEVQALDRVGRISMPIGNLAPGLYLFEVQTANKRLAQPISIVR